MRDLISNHTEKRNEFAYSVLGWFIVLWTMALAGWVYVYSIRQGGAPNWDEFERLAWASEIWQSLWRCDWFHFWRHTNSQVIWPFLHSWLTAFLFLLFGPAVAVARLLSLFAFLGSSLMVFYAVVREQSRFSWLGGIAAWSLFTLSPIVINNSASIMSEMFGLWMTLLILLCLPRDESQEKTGRLLAPSIFLSLFFFYKYNFALLTWCALISYRFAVAGFSPRRMISRGNILLFGLPVAALAVWFLPFWSFKTQHFVNFLTNNPEARTPFGWDFWLYYFRSIPIVYYPSPILGFVSAAAVLFAGILDKRLRLSNPFLVCFAVHFLAAAVHPMKMERFQFIPMGLFFILTGQTAATLADWASDRFKIKDATQFWIAALVCAAILIPSVHIHSRAYRNPIIKQGSPHFAPMQAMLDHVETSDRVALLITHDLLCTPSVNYYYISGKNQSTIDLRRGVVQWGMIFLYQSKTEILAMDADKQIQTLRKTLQRTNSNKIAVLESTRPELIGYFDKMYGGTQEIIRLVSLLPEFALVYEKEFPKEYARVRIYALIDPGATEKTQTTHE